METRQLRYFVAVVESGSLSRAAGVSHVVQSALSHQMGQLEEELGVALLSRSVRGVQVTEPGAVLYRHARAILKQIDNARMSVLASRGAVAGSVAIGIPNSTAAVVATGILESVRTRSPDIRLSIVEANSEQLAQMLSNGRLDVSFLYHTNALHGLEAEVLLSEALCLVSPLGVDVPLLPGSEATVPLESLAGLPLILSGHPNATRLLIEDACRLQGLELNVVAEVAALETLRDVVAAGLGSTILTAATIAKIAGMAGRMQAPRMIAPRIDRTLLLARPRDFPCTAPADAVYRLARHVALGLVADGQWPGAQLLAAPDT